MRDAPTERWAETSEGGAALRGEVSQPTMGPLRDRFGRVFNYLRIALTDRCNLRCVYCLPEQGVVFADHDKLLTAEEVSRVVRVAAGLGVGKIRFTGGEPLLVKDIVPLVARTHATPGIRSVHITTNGVRLSEMAEPLRRAGLHGVNVSLDTLDPERFKQVTRRTGIEDVLAGLKQAVRVGFPSVKVNVVAMRGVNDGEIDDFVALVREHPITVRFIELMPFDADQIWKTGRFLSSARLAASFRERHPASEPAQGSSTEHLIFRLPGHVGKIAFVPAHTRSLCGECTRIRLTADGQLRNCLYSEEEFDLRAVLRGGGSDDDLAATIRGAMWIKPRDGWEAQRQTWKGVALGGRLRESMTKIGG